MEIITEKSKVMINTKDNSIHANNTHYGDNLDEFDKFCYLSRSFFCSFSLFNVYLLLFIIFIYYMIIFDHFIKSFTSTII